MIRLTHPVHGVKHAIVEQEAMADEKNGWVREELKEEVKEEEVKRKPGRPKVNP